MFSFVSNCLNSIPVVGHGKAVIHYVLLDGDGAKKAFYESTRSTVLVAAGAAGSVAGPVGAAALAVSAGALMDSATSIVTDTPTGIVKGIQDIATDISNGEIPVGSVLKTSINIGADCLSGIGGGGLTSAATSAYETAVIQTVEKAGEDVVARKILEIAGTGIAKKAFTHGAINAVRSEISSDKYHGTSASRNNNSTSNTFTSNQTKSDSKKKSSEEKKSTASGSTSSGASGSGPPRKNHNNKDGRKSDILSEFMALLESIIHDLKDKNKMKIKEIFKDLSIEQKESLVKIIEQLKTKNNFTKRLLRVVIIILRDYFPNEPPNFSNFLSLINVAAILLEKYNDGSDLQNEFTFVLAPDILNEFIYLLASIIQDLKEENQEKILNIFKNLSYEQNQILVKITQQLKTKNNLTKRLLLLKVVKVVQRILTDYFPNEPPNFSNFLNFINVAAILLEKYNDESDILNEFIFLLASIVQDLKEENQEKILNIFKGLSNGQITDLLKKMQEFKNNGFLKEVLKIVAEILTEHFPTSFNFPDFLSFAELVAIYFTEEGATRNKSLRKSTTFSYDERKIGLIVILGEESDILIKIKNKYLKIKSEFEAEISPPNEPLSLNFRNIVAAVSHYFKHRIVSDNVILSVKKYCEWIRNLLKLVKKRPDYLDFTEVLIFEVYVEEYAKRIRLVLKKRNGEITLSTVFFKKPKKGDKDGDEFIQKNYFN